MDVHFNGTLCNILIFQGGSSSSLFSVGIQLKSCAQVTVVLSTFLKYHSNSKIGSRPLETKTFAYLNKKTNKTNSHLIQLI